MKQEGNESSLKVPGIYFEERSGSCWLQINDFKTGCCFFLVGGTCAPGCCSSEPDEASSAYLGFSLWE